MLSPLPPAERLALQRFAARHGLSAPQAVDALIDYATMREYVTDPAARSTMDELFKSAVATAAAPSGFKDEDNSDE